MVGLKELLNNMFSNFHVHNEMSYIPLACSFLIAYILLIIVYGMGLLRQDLIYNFVVNNAVLSRA